MYFINVIFYIDAIKFCSTWLPHQETILHHPYIIFNLVSSCDMIKVIKFYYSTPADVQS